MAHSEVETFDGLDNRKEIMILLHRLGSDQQRACFLESLIPNSANGFSSCPIQIRPQCDAISAYFMMVGICNELGVSINVAAKALEKKVRKL